MEVEHKLKRRVKISTKKIMVFLQKHKYHVFNQDGSHVILIQEQTQNQLTIPVRKELGRVTLDNILSRAKISYDELFKFILKGKWESTSW